MKTLGIIALLTLLPSTECAHPHYTFRCLENGEIDLFGIHNTSNIISLNGAGSCNKTDVELDSTKQYYIIPKKCANSITRDYSVQIVVKDPTFDVKGTTSTPQSSQSTTVSTTTTPTTNTPANGRRKRDQTQIIGGYGNHWFNVTCKNIPEEGVNRTVVHVLQGKEYNALPVNYMEVDSVEMRFKAVNNTNAPDINTIYVGDEFFMFLEYKGTKDYSVRPKTCVAYSGTFLNTGSTNKVDLWNRSNTSCTPNKDLLQSFNTTSSTKRIYAKMFGFRFSNSEYITIQCEVGIFPPSNSKKELCDNNSKRKRRGIENVEVKTKFAASKIRVYDNKDMYQMENKSPQKSFDFSGWIVPVIGTLLYRW